jgi:allantoin racemase
VKVVTEDGADVIISGCTGMVGMAGKVEDGLKRRGITDVPAIDAAMLTSKIAEALADMGLSHSKRPCPAPPKKEAVGC